MQAKAAREGRMVSTVWFRYRKWRGWLGGPRAPNESIHNPLFKTARCQHWTQLRVADLTAHSRPGWPQTRQLLSKKSLRAANVTIVSPTMRSQANIQCTSRRLRQQKRDLVRGRMTTYLEDVETKRTPAEPRTGSSKASGMALN